MRLYQISLSLCLAVTAITTTPVFAKAPANTQPILQHDIIDKNLVNEWVQYKFLNMKIEQEGENFQNKLLPIIQGQDEQLFLKFQKEIKNLFIQGDQQIQALQFRNPSMQKLAKLQHENFELVLKVLPDHFALVFYPEDEIKAKIGMDSEQHIKEFMKASATTAAVKQQEALIEAQVWQYLKDHPL